MNRLAGPVLAILILTTSQAPAGAQSELTVAAIRENVKVAMGVLPASETLTTSLTKSGLTGSDVFKRSGKDYRVDITLGPIHTAYGSVGGVPWRQNPNGETVANSSAPLEPVNEATTTSVAHITKPSDLYVISRLTTLGRGSKEYIDPATWHIVRFEYIAPNETTTTSYDDFHTVSGYTRAWHRAVTDGHAENDANYTVTGDDVGPVSAAALAVPKDRRKLVEFPAGQTSVQVPVRLDTRYNKFIVRLMVGSRGLDFVLDSGAAGIVIDRDVAQSLGLPEYNSYSSAANAGRYVGTTTIVPDIAIGDLRMHNVVVSTTPNLGIDGVDFKVVGLLGFDFLRDIGAKLDDNAGTITAYDPSSFVPPGGEHTINLDVRLGSFTPETTVTINGAVGTRFTIDTGGIGALMISDYFRRRYPDAVLDEHHAPHVRELRGVGGGFQANAIILAQYKLGRATFVDSQAYVINSSKAYGYDEDGFIGCDLLRAFTVYLDFPHDKVYLVPDPAK